MASNRWCDPRRALHLLQDRLVLCRAPNISVHFASLCLGGPLLVPDLGLFRIAVFNPLPHGEFILGMWVTASLNTTYGSSILR